MISNNLTPAQAERLAMLAEEAGEIAQMAGKTLRFGFSSTHPDGGPTNLDLLIEELQDLMAVVKLMNGPDLQNRMDGVPAKREKVERKVRYSLHQTFSYGPDYGRMARETTPQRGDHVLDPEPYDWFKSSAPRAEPRSVNFEEGWG